MPGVANTDAAESRVRTELQSLEILKGVSEEIAWRVLRCCSTKQLGPGEVLLRKGQPNRVMYFLLEGRLGIYLIDQPSEPIAFLEKGQTVGEMSVMDGSPASAHVIAMEMSLLLEVAHETFWRLANASHQFAINLLFLLAQRMRDNNTSLQRAALLRSQLERDANVDALTGLYNRRWWDDKFKRMLDRAERCGSASLSLLVIDVDRFKQYNDTYGHAAGDVALRTVGKVLAQSIRPTDIAVRYGGEEFAVLLPGTELSGALIAADRVRQAISDTAITQVDGDKLPCVTISLGVATLHSGDEPATLFQRADAALYRAKNSGRNRVEVERNDSVR
ncbi:MAG TPA: GGDEF domain-containing protein [Polyangiaceae bacterium]|nr:GGDEF domain-containing protein [Polyangiaceae bacterium]